MLYNEEYLLSQVRTLSERVDWLTGLLGATITVVNIGGASRIFHGNGVPVDPPTSPSLIAIYIDDDDGVIYRWDISSQTWK